MKSDTGVEISKNPKLDELISLAEAAEKSGLSASHIRLLVRNGKLWGKKFGRNWLTSSQALNVYLSSDRKLGPKPRKTS